jgi:hypothetical protein
MWKCRSGGGSNSSWWRRRRMAKRENMRALAVFLLVTHLQSRRYSEILEVFVYEDCQTLKQLNKVRENHIGRGRPVLKSRYRGIILRDDAKVSYLVMDLRNIGTPRFSVNTGGLPRNWQDMASGSSDFDDDVKAAHG